MEFFFFFFFFAKWFCFLSFGPGQTFYFYFIFNKVSWYRLSLTAREFKQEERLTHTSYLVYLGVPWKDSKETLQVYAWKEGKEVLYYC